MSTCFLKKEIELFLTKDRSPITFVHRKDLPREKNFVLHLNDHVEIYVYLSGDIGYIVEDEYIPLERGDVVVIFPHEVHVPVICSEREYERIYMLLPIDTVADFFFDPRTCLASVKHHKIALPKDKREVFLNLMMQISDMADGMENDGQKTMALGLFLQAHGILIDSIDRPTSEEPKLPSGVPRQIREILNYIGGHIQEIDSADAVARHFYISPQYLSSFFKKHVGINIHEYLQIKRIALAKILLESGKSVAEVAFACGFSDSSHFIKIFKRYVGNTPKQYQNSLK